MKLGSLRHTLDCFYFASLGIQTQHKTGENCATINQNRACATLTKFATVFCSGQGQIFTQHFEQSLVWGESDFRSFAVQCETDVGLLLHWQENQDLRSCHRRIFLLSAIENRVVDQASLADVDSYSNQD